MTSDEELNRLATEATGVTPTLVELLSAQRLIEYGRKEAERRGEQGVADAGQDFMRRFEDVDVTLAEMLYFQREWLNTEGDI